MNTPEKRFTVLPLLVAFLHALMSLPMTTVVLVKSRGMGFEHEQPWRTRALASMATLVDRLVARVPVSRHALARGALVAVALAGTALVLDVELRTVVNVLAVLALAGPVAFGTTLTETMHPGEFLLGERPDGGSREVVTVLSGQNLNAGAVVGRVNKGASAGRVTVPTVVGTGNGTVNTVYAGPDVEVGNYVLTNTSAVTHGGVWSLTTPSGKALPALTMTPGAGGSTVYRSRHINFTIVDGSTDFALADVFTFVVSSTAPTVIGTGNGTVSGLSAGPDAITGNYRLEITAAITNGGEFKLTGPDGDIVEQGFIVAGAGGTFVGANKRQLNLTLTEGSTDFAVGDAFNIAVYNELSGGKVVAWDPLTYDGRDDIAGVLLAKVDASSGDLVGVLVARDAAVAKAALSFATAITASQKESAYKEMADKIGIVAR